MTASPLNLDLIEQQARKAITDGSIQIEPAIVVYLVSDLRDAQQQLAAERARAEALEGVVNSQMETDSDQMATIASLDCSLRVERAKREHAMLNATDGQRRAELFLSRWRSGDLGYANFDLCLAELSIAFKEIAALLAARGELEGGDAR